MMCFHDCTTVVYTTCNYTSKRTVQCMRTNCTNSTIHPLQTCCTGQLQMVTAAAPINQLLATAPAGTLP
jgi:hypothetical protein